MNTLLNLLLAVTLALGSPRGASAQSRTEITRQSFAGVTASVSTNVVGAARQLRSAVDTFDSGYGNATYRAIGMASGVMQAADAVRSLSNPSASASLSLGFSQSSVAQYERATGIVPAELDAGRDLTLAAGRDLALVAGRDLVDAIAPHDVISSVAQLLDVRSVQPKGDASGGVEPRGPDIADAPRCPGSAGNAGSGFRPRNSRTGTRAVDIA